MKQRIEELTTECNQARDDLTEAHLQIDSLRLQLDEAMEVIEEVVERRKKCEQSIFRFSGERNQVRRDLAEAVEVLLSVACFYVGDIANAEEFRLIDTSYDMPQEEAERSLWRKVRTIVAKHAGAEAEEEGAG